MASESEVSPEELRAELDTIKDAMGLRERYPGRIRSWLVYGLAVPIAALASQYIELATLPAWYHAPAWVLTMVLAGIVAGAVTQSDGGPASEGKPRIALQFASVLAFYAVIVVGLSPVLDGAARDIASATVFALVVGLTGVAYLVVGNSLRAFYIRRRDRLALYGGGGWMLAYAALMPNVALLVEWGYAGFGVAYAAYALAAYAVLTTD